MGTLLVADDSLFQRFMVARVVKEEGFDVVEAKSGTEALEIVLSQQLSGLLLDMNMPEMNGLKVLQELKERGMSLPVLIITADIQDSTRERCHELGVRHILNKPLDEKALRLKLKEIFA